MSPPTTSSDETGALTRDSGMLALELTPVDGDHEFELERIFASASQKLFGIGPGPRVGRYRVDRLIGSGGMGDVYLGEDEELRRKVAIKLVRGAAAERDQQRLRREARALAKLRHPNIVAVYEVGKHEQRTYVAMEYVEGQSLAKWLDEAEQPWHDVFERFLAAGRGLVAVHDIGIIHRDFKPDNVLLGVDGAVRVADFGVAVSMAQQPQPRPEGSPALTDIDAPLTETRSIGGTIKYMPLEQLRGETIDARSDQFAFCVALYEALWRASPFDGSSTQARIEALERGQPTTPPRTSVPGGLWRVLRRGLARERRDRWTDMNALLDALERVLRRRRRRRVGGLCLAIAGLGGGLLSALWTPEDPCAAVARELDGVWDATRKDTLHRHVDTLGSGLAANGERISSELDAWARVWTDAREQLCRIDAARVDEPRRLERRDSCLTRERSRVQQLVNLLEQADQTAFAHAIDAVAALPSPAACDGPLALLGVDPPPAAVSAEVDALRTEIDRAHQLRLLGRLEQGHAAISSALPSAVELDYGPALAEARAELAKSEVASGSLARGIELYRAAIDLSEVHRLDHLRAELWLELAQVSLFKLGDVTAGSAHLHRAEIAYARVGADARAQARLAHARGRVAQAREEPELAEEAYREAIATIEGTDAEDLPHYLNSLADVLRSEQPEAALALHERALEFARRRYGPRHPNAVEELANYGRALLLAGKDGSAQIEQAAAIWAETHTRAHEHLAEAQFVLAAKALEQLDLDEAEVHAKSAKDMLASALPAQHPDHGGPDMLLARIEAMRAHPQPALAHARAALAHFERSEGHQELERILDARSFIASKLVELGQLDEAAAALEQLLIQAEPSSAIGLEARVNVIELYLARGQVELADAQFAAVAGVPLGVHALPYAVLRVLTTLRLGQRVPNAQLAAVRAAYGTMPFTEEQVAAWLDGLRPSDAERELLLAARSNGAG